MITLLYGHHVKHAAIVLAVLTASACGGSSPNARQNSDISTLKGQVSSLQRENAKLRLAIKRIRLDQATVGLGIRCDLHNAGYRIKCPLSLR